MESEVEREMQHWLKYLHASIWSVCIEQRTLGLLFLFYHVTLTIVKEY